MKAMREALLKHVEKGKLGEMVRSAADKHETERLYRREARAAAARKRVEETFARMKQKHAKTLASKFEDSVYSTKEEGLGDMKPISFLDWKPAIHVLAEGKPAKILWGLANDTCKAVVVRFDYPQKLTGLSSELSTVYGIFPTNQLAECNCDGYMHRKCIKRR